MVDSSNEIPSYFTDRIKAAKEQKLTELDLSSPNNFYKLDYIPEAVFELTQLEKLYLRANRLKKIPESIDNLLNLTQLSLSNNQLTNLPESIGNLSKLTLLNLNYNQLTNLPESFGALSNLTELYLSGNQLTNLPEVFGNLSNLALLNSSNNQLTNLPEVFGNLSNLTRLNLRNNQLTNLPKSIGNLSSLTELYLTGNQLTNLPESFGNLSNLTKLSLTGNQLTNLPKSFGNLFKLTKLYLTENQLTNLPESFGNLLNFITLDLSRNPLEIPPIEIAERGITAIKKYFQQLRKEGEDYIYEAKLLIVGEAGAGKTTLANKIQNPQYQLQYPQTSTEGIDVNKWSFSLDNKLEFKVNIWDFGGQEIYHATHQFFLTKRSLYILVADSRKEDTDFYYWLNIIELLSNNSPLLIIKNEKQDRQRDINERALRGQFTNLKETLATNLATNRGLEDIINNIQYYIQSLPLIGQALPKTWVKVRQALEEDKRNYISLDEYLDICEANGFTRLEDKLQLSGYLHDLGVCLHFQDEEDSLLYKTLILKPQWGTDAVYAVLDNKQVINNKGHFTRDDLKNIWQEEKYASMRGELRELMKKFQLCYEIPDRKDIFIAPQLLSDTQPEYDWDESNNLILRYTYSDFMPKGIITRFIVIMHQYIDQQKYVWKTGVILNKDNAKAEVIEDYGKREIRIRVVGTDKRGLMTIVTHELDKINNSYNRLKYQKLIPCNCETCNNSQNPFPYEFKKLLERSANKKLTIECGNPPYHEVQVLGLIDNAIDIKQFIPQDKQDSNKSFHFEGNIQKLVVQLLEQGDVSNINQSHSGNGDNVAEDKNVTTDQSRTQNISGGKINATGAGAFNLGDIYGTVANTINQLPSSANPDEPGIKELLTQLQAAIDAPNLSADDQEEALEQLQVLAAAGQNPQEQTMQKKAKKAVGFLKVIAEGVEPATKLAQACATVLPKILLFFGLGS